MALQTYNFCLTEAESPETSKTTHRLFKDRRNGISSIYITPGIQCYMNYMNLLVQLRSKWVSNGYLDLGMIPVISGPSFMHKTLVDAILPALKLHSIIVHALPGVSFMINNGFPEVTDYWAFRDDLSGILNCQPNEVTVSKLFNKILVGGLI